MQNEPRVTMASPAPGFTSRVIARIEERERAQARRRALIGAVLLVIAVAIVLAFAISGVVSSISMIAHPEAISPIVIAFATLFDDWARLIEGLWVAVTVIAQNVGEVPLLVYACSVLAMTAIWLQIVTGSFRHILTLRIGGLR
jgi:hypothetical protein